MFAAHYRPFIFQAFLCDQISVTQHCYNFALIYLMILKAEEYGCPLWPVVLAPGLEWDKATQEQSTLEHVLLERSTLQSVVLRNTAMG